MRTGSRRWRRGERRDARRERRGEQRRLAHFRSRREDRVEVLGESHVEHLVGLVEDERAEAAESERAAVHVVERAPGRRDDDVHPALQRLQLRLHRRAPVNGEDADADLAAVPVDGLGELHRELAGRNENEDRGRDPPFGLRADAVEDRERESGRLPGARRCLREDVTALEERRDRRALDGRGLLVPQGDERAHEARVEAKGREGRRRGLVHGPILTLSQRMASKTPVARSFLTLSHANQRPFMAT